MRASPIPFVLVLTLCGGILQAGVEPSPFLPQIRKLEAIEHVLLVTYAKEDRILSAPPGTQLPSGPLGVQLKAIRFHLALKESQVVRVVTPVLDEGLAPGEIGPALEAITTAVEGIQNRAAQGFTFPVSDPEVLEALSGVETQAASVVSATEAFLPGVECPCWTEEEIAYSTRTSGLLYSECSINETSGWDYMLIEDNDEGTGIGFVADSNGSFPYECNFWHQGGFVPQWGTINRSMPIDLEYYEACAASICKQILAAPAWYRYAFEIGPYDPSQCTSIVGE